MATVWLLDMRIGGVDYRFATRATSVTLANGTSVQYEGGLGDLTLGSSATSAERSEAVTVATSVDWAAVVARGASLDDQPAAIRLYRSGDVLETARTYVRGRTDSARPGNVGEPLAITVRENAMDQAFELPVPQAIVEDETWPVTVSNVLVEKNAGKPYPVPIGIPGHHPKAGATYIPEAASPMVYAEYRPNPSPEGWRVVADGHIQATKVYMYDATKTNGTGLAVTVSTRTDALGRITTGYDGGVIADEEVLGEWWCGFGNQGVYGGGKLNPYGPGLLRGAGDVIRWVLEECTTLDIDTAAIIGASSWLNRWKVDAVINESVNMLEWLDSEVLAHIPVMRVNGPRGIYYAPMRWDAADSDVVAHLLPGMVSRVSPPTQYDSETRNSMTLQYRPQRDGAAYGSRRVLGPEYGRNESGWGLLGMTSLPWNTTNFTDVRFFADPLCRWSAANVGPREWSGTNASCWDDASIALSLDYMAMRYAVPKRLVRYGGPADPLEGLEPGAVVRLTDPLSYDDAVLALVVERLTSTTQVYLDLVILDDPFKTSRKTD